MVHRSRAPLNSTSDESPRGTPSYSYEGSELDLFAEAKNWKRYWSSKMRPFVTGNVLEVGAGVGSNAPWLLNENCQTWTALEPDAALATRLSATLSALPTSVPRSVVIGTVPTLPEQSRFNSIVYIDVLEHILDDRAELVHASSVLESGGYVIVLAPAHQWLFTPFDAAVGHWRRYTRKSLLALAPPALRSERAIYVDAAGILASLGNRLLLRKSGPTAQQLLTWDRLLVPVSRLIDPLFFWHLGKSVLAIWRKSPD